jgi:hypothetical protein
MERCPVCHQGTLRIIAAILETSVVKKILRHVKLAVDPPPIAPARQAAAGTELLPQHERPPGPARVDFLSAVPHADDA